LVVQVVVDDEALLREPVEPMVIMDMLAQAPQVVVEVVVLVLLLLHRQLS
jgi:hypothetical protein